MTEESRPDGRSSRLARVAGVLFLTALLAILTANVWLLSAQLQTNQLRSRAHAFWALCHAGTTPEKRTEYFLQLVRDGNQEWQSARLSDLQLDNADLANARLEAAVFSNCQFRGADFSEAILNDSGLDNSDLTDAFFANAEITNATLFKSVLKDADFRNAVLRSTSLEQARAHDASFVAAKMGDAFLALTDATGADFTGADLSGANLEAAVLRDTDLALANLFGTNLKDTDFTNSNWWRARGLSSQQLDDLTLNFPPNPEAADSRQRDFEIWLSKRINESPKGRPALE